MKNRIFKIIVAFVFPFTDRNEFKAIIKKQQKLEAIELLVVCVSFKYNAIDKMQHLLAISPRTFSFSCSNRLRIA